MYLLPVVLKKNKFFFRRFFPDEKVFPGFEFSQLNMFPVIQTCTPHGLFVNFEAVGFYQNEFKIEGDTSAPDTPGVSGNLGRK